MAAISARRCARILACCLGLALAACGSKPTVPKPTTVSGIVQASAQVNPTTARRPSPIQLRIYELKSAAAFSSADFMSLFQGDQAALGAELVAREELMLQPGESRPYAKTLSGETRFIGVVAAYRDLERATWRAVTPVQPGLALKLTIHAGELAVTAALAP